MGDFLLRFVKNKGELPKICNFNGGYTKIIERFIYNLEKLGIFDIPENIKTEEVVIGKDQIVRECFIYQAPVGTEAPNI